MAVYGMTVKIGQQPTEEQKRRIKEALDRPIFYDDDAPKLTDEQYKDFEKKLNSNARYSKQRMQGDFSSRFSIIVYLYQK